MKTVIMKCDIEDLEHSGGIHKHEFEVIFDHDQEDGKSTVKPYTDVVTIDICESCIQYIMEHRRMIYAYGAMGNNKYYLTK